jgi:putative oxidoreductase
LLLNEAPNTCGEKIFAENAVNRHTILLTNKLLLREFIEGRTPTQRCFMSINEKISATSPYLLSTVRIVVALLFIEHGSMKLLGFPPSSQPVHLVLFSLHGLSGVLELLGGLVLLPGLFTRPVAFILSGEMAAAYFIAHASKSFFPALNMGELAVVYSFVFLYFAAAGGGPWSVDHMLEHEGERATRTARATTRSAGTEAAAWR